MNENHLVDPAAFYWGPNIERQSSLTAERVFAGVPVVYPGLTLTVEQAESWLDANPDYRIYVSSELVCRRCGAGGVELEIESIGEHVCD